MGFSYKDSKPPADKVTKLRLLLLNRREPQYLTAAMAGIAPTQMTAYVTGRYMPIPARSAIRLANVLGCDPDELQGWAEAGPVMDGWGDEEEVERLEREL